MINIRTVYLARAAPEPAERSEVSYADEQSDLSQRKPRDPFQKVIFQFDQVALGNEFLLRSIGKCLRITSR